MRQVEVDGDLERGRLARELGAELALRAVDLVELLDDVHRHADRPSLVRDRARHRLTDPPGRVRRELEALAPVELLGRAHEADRPLLDQVEERQALVAVALRDGDDESEVRLDHRLLRGVVAGLDPLGELDLLRRREERHLADVLQEELQRVGRDLGLGRLPRALALGLDRRLGDDDLDLLLVERVVERVDLRGVEVELVESQRELVGVEPTLRTAVLEQRPRLVRREHGIRIGRRAFRVTRCSAQDRPFRRVARNGSHEVPLRQQRRPGSDARLVRARRGTLRLTRERRAGLGRDRPVELGLRRLHLARPEEQEPEVEPHRGTGRETVA